VGARNTQGLKKNSPGSGRETKPVKKWVTKIISATSSHVLEKGDTSK